MPITITMPALSPTMTEGTLAKWLMKEGDAVQSGDMLAEIETDKATMEVESIDEGVLARILVAEGTEGVPVNTPIAILLEEGEDASVSSTPDALVLFNPVYDNGPKGYGHDRVKDRWKEISPIHNIRKGVPPAIVFLGDQDKLIPVSTAQNFKALMEKAGSRSDLHVYKDQPHGFFNKGKKGNYYEKTVLEMDKFLISLGWLKGKPTIKAPE